MKPPIHCALITALALGASAGQAVAETTTDRDLQCVAVFAAAAAKAGEETEDPKPKVAQVGMGLMYFLGRLEGQDPSVVWLDRLHQEMRGTTMEQLQSYAQRCAVLLEAKGRELQAMGKLMQQDGAAQK